MKKIELYAMFAFGWVCGAWWMFKKCYPHLREFFANNNTDAIKED